MMESNQGNDYDKYNGNGNCKSIGSSRENSPARKRAKKDDNHEVCSSETGKEDNTRHSHSLQVEVAHAVPASAPPFASATKEFVLFQQLPDALLNGICDFCDFQSLLRLRRTSLSLHKASNHTMQQREAYILQVRQATTAPAANMTTTSTTILPLEYIEEASTDRAANSSASGTNLAVEATTGTVAAVTSPSRATLRFGWSKMYRNKRRLVRDALTYANPAGPMNASTTNVYSDRVARRLLENRGGQDCIGWIDNRDFSPLGDGQSYHVAVAATSGTHDDERQVHEQGTSYQPSEPGWGVLIKYGNFTGNIAWKILHDMVENFHNEDNESDGGIGENEIVASTRRSLHQRKQQHQKHKQQQLFLIKEYTSILLFKSKPISVLCGFRRYDHRYHRELQRDVQPSPMEEATPSMATTESMLAGTREAEIAIEAAGPSSATSDVIEGRHTLSSGDAVGIGDDASDTSTRSICTSNSNSSTVWVCGKEGSLMFYTSDNRKVELFVKKLAT